MKLLFNAWVNNNGGADAIADKLGVTGFAVRVWMRGEGSPLTENIVKILKLSKDQLTFEQIIKETTRSKK